MPSTAFQADVTPVTGRLYRAWRDRTRAAYISCLGSPATDSPHATVTGTNSDFTTYKTLKFRLLPSHVGPTGTRLALYCGFSQTDANDQGEYRIRDSTSGSVSQTVTKNGVAGGNALMVLDWDPTPPGDNNGTQLSIQMQINAKNGGGVKTFSLTGSISIPGSGGSAGPACWHYIMGLPL